MSLVKDSRVSRHKNNRLNLEQPKYRSGEQLDEK